MTDFRSQPPTAGPIPSIDIGTFDTMVLDNGLTLIVVENRKLPKVAFNLVINHDPVLEGPLAGMTELTGELISRGTRTRSKAQIDETVDYYGANLQTGSSGIYGSVLTKYVEPFLAVFTDVLMHATFPETEFDKIKLKHQSKLQTVQNEPSEMAYNVRTKANFQSDHPYSDVMTSETLERVTVSDCRQYFDQYWRPGCSYLAVVGDMSIEEVRDIVAPRMVLWQKGDVPRHEYPSATAPKRNRLCIVDRPNAVQSELRVTYPVDLHPASRDRIPATVMNHILGGGAFSGYLMSNLREDKGFTYGVRSHLNMDPIAGEFEVATSVGTEVTVAAIREIMHEMNRIRSEAVTDDHLELAKNALIGSFARSIENPQTLANRVLNMLRFELPGDFYQTFTAELNQISSEDIQRIANQIITPDQCNIVLVGNWSAIKEEFIATFKEASVEFYDAFGRILADV